jgi:ribonuclease R
MAERRADDATRDVSDWLKCEFMQDHVGDVFDGVVASVTNFGLFVRITEFQIDGLVHITSLPSDYYHFDEQKQCLVGESAGLVYHLGDEVKIKVAGVNLDDRKIDLLIEGTTKVRGSLKKARKNTDRKTKARKGKAPRAGKAGAATTKPASDKTPAEAKPSESKKGAGKKGKASSTRKRSGPKNKAKKSSKNKQRK